MNALFVKSQFDLAPSRDYDSTLFSINVYKSTANINVYRRFLHTFRIIDKVSQSEQFCSFWLTSLECKHLTPELI